MKTYNYILTTEKSGFIQGTKEAKNKLSANVLITKEYVNKGFENFKVEIL